MLKNKKLKEIFAPEFLDYLSGFTLTLEYKKEGVWHSTEGRHCPERAEAARHTETFQVSELRNENLCVECFNPARLYNPLESSRGYQVVEQVVDLRNKFISKGKVNEKTSAGAVQGRLLELPIMIKEVENLKDNYPKLEEPLQKIKELGEGILKKLESLSKSDDAKDKLERAVQRHLVPKKFKDQSFELDPTMVLIGISPSPYHYWSNTTNNTVQAVLKAYSIRSDKVTVLYAPAYFYSYLLGVLFFKNKEQTLVVSAAAPDDPEARDNAAHLWDPENESVLACLSKATLSGEALSG